MTWIMYEFYLLKAANAPNLAYALHEVKGSARLQSAWRLKMKKTRCRPRCSNLAVLNSHKQRTVSVHLTSHRTVSRNGTARETLTASESSLLGSFI